MNISVVVPALNESENIGRCLDSLLAQTRQADEIIVVDNGSEDDTAEIALSYGVKVLSFPRPDVKFGDIGLVRQKGVEEANGDIIISADADIIYPREHIEKIEKIYAADPYLVLLGGPVFSSVRNVVNDLLDGVYNFHRSYWTGWGIPLFFGANMSFRRGAFLKTDGYRGAAAHGPVEELIVGFRLSRVGNFMWCDDVYCYSQRVLLA